MSIITQLLQCHTVDPSEPENVTVVRIGPTWIVISWVGPTFQGLPEFTKFTVSAEPTNATNSNGLAMVAPQKVAVSVSMDVLYANVTDVFPGEEYNLSVVAISENSGVQASSNPSAVVSALTHTTGMHRFLFLLLVLYLVSYDC